MITLRPASARGRTKLSWLDGRHTFSFGDYVDPVHHRFRALRVINEDRVAPGGGFDTHAHKDMEILTWVLEGAREHKDSMGNGSTIRPGELQRMSAGTGVTHSEKNPSKTEPVRLLQIWILPEKNGLKPEYEQRDFAEAHGLTLLAARDGKKGAVTVHQDASVWLARPADAKPVDLAMDPARGLWVQVARGTIELRAGKKVVELVAGDGAAVEAVEDVRVTARGATAEALLFDLK
jgi:quercetin 2,3-dioxygenase